jgi:hypothetical protein
LLNYNYQKPINSHSKKRKIIKNLIIISSIILIALVLNPNFIAKFNNYQEIVAEIGGRKISYQELRHKINQIANQNPQQYSKIANLSLSEIPEKILKQAIKTIYLEKEAVYQAKKEQFTKIPEIATELAIKNQEEVYKLYIKHLTEKTTNNNELLKEYQSIKQEVEQQKIFSYNLILFGNQEDANQFNILTEKEKLEIINPASKNDFINLHPITINKQINEEQKILKDIVKILEAMSTKQFSAPLLISEKWTIIQLEEAKNQKMPSFEESRDQIKQKLIDKTINNLYHKNDSDIKIFIKSYEYKQEIKSIESPNQNIIDLKENINNTKPLINNEERKDEDNNSVENSQKNLLVKQKEPLKTETKKIKPTIERINNPEQSTGKTTEEKAEKPENKEKKKDQQKTENPVNESNKDEPKKKVSSEKTKEKTKDKEKEPEKQDNPKAESDKKENSPPKD